MIGFRVHKKIRFTPCDDRKELHWEAVANCKHKLNISDAQKSSIVLNGCSLVPSFGEVDVHDISTHILWHVAAPALVCLVCRVHSYSVLHNKLHTIARKMMSCDAVRAGLRDVLGAVQAQQFSENQGPNSYDCLANYGQFLADITRLSCLNYPKSARSHPRFVCHVRLPVSARLVPVERWVNLIRDIWKDRSENDRKGRDKGIMIDLMMFVTVPVTTARSLWHLWHTICLQLVHEPWVFDVPGWIVTFKLFQKLLNMSSVDYYFVSFLSLLVPDWLLSNE